MENKAVQITSKTGKALLFDMDGTLTPARNKISSEMQNVLCELSAAGHAVCIVSGSPMNYIQEQLKTRENEYSDTLVIMPCNGTQVFTLSNSSSEYELLYGLTMKDFLEQNSSLTDPYKDLVTNILELQLYAMRKYKFSPTGNFVSDRGSMLNWSMIGRDASHEVRDTFTIEETTRPIRKHLCECLRVRLDDSGLHGIDLTLGGSTSIDIFPKGWDKTYALNHLSSDTEAWFWGDKCHPLGNDHELWKVLQPASRSFEVSSPADTLTSIKALQAEGKL